MKYIFLSLLLSVQLFAYEKGSKIKAYHYLNNYSSVKLMIESLMYGKEEAWNAKADVEYITNIKVKADNKLIYNINTTSKLNENPLLKFDYKDINPSSVTLEYTDNHGIIKTKITKKIMEYNHKRKIPKPIKLLKNPKTYPNKLESIKKLFGNITLIEDGIQLTAPRLADGGSRIPIRIRSDIKFKSIALFMSNYSRTSGNKFKLASQWFSTPYSIVNFSLRVKMRQSEEVIVVLEAENGNFYTLRQEIDVAIAGRGMGG